MDIEEFEGLIDDYQDAQRDGGYSDRAKARGALKDAFRAIEAERDAMRKALLDCVLVMELDLAGLLVIQPELRQARIALAKTRGEE